MIFCKELNRSFENNDEMFAALKANVDEIISIKKKQIQKSCDKGSSVIARPLDIYKLSTEIIKELNIDSDFYYIVVNTTNILDSHTDLHLPKIWNKTAKEQSKKNYLVDSHVLSLSTTIVKNFNIEILIVKIPFSAIGKEYKGETTALIYKFRKDTVINAVAKEWLESGDPVEASVRMQYIDMVLALNSDRKEDKAEKKNFDKYFPEIANKDDFEEILYFWAIKEAKNVNESSLVLFGSNSSTGPLLTEETVQQNNKALEEQAATKALETEKAAKLKKRRLIYHNLHKN